MWANIPFCTGFTGLRATGYGLRGHWRRLNVKCKKERREEVGRYQQTPAAMPASLAFVVAPARPPPAPHHSFQAGPLVLVFHHGFCSTRATGARWMGRQAVSRSRGNGVVVTNVLLCQYCPCYAVMGKTGLVRIAKVQA